MGNVRLPTLLVSMTYLDFSSALSRPCNPLLHQQSLANPLRKGGQKKGGGIVTAAPSSKAL
jgi:hypothetical protein